MRTRRVLALAAVLVVAVGIASTQLCLRGWLRHGVVLGQCPDGKLLPVVTLNAPSLARGAEGTVWVSVGARYAVSDSQTERSTLLPRFSPKLFLIGGGQTLELKPAKSWERSNAGQQARIELPKVNDGDYFLRAEVESSAGPASVELPLPLYTPARVHVLTDRPLYEPGNTVKFRAVAFRATDLNPLEERPGVFRVQDPSGEVLLEEKAPSGPWGIAVGSFPLESQAASGNWTVSWASGATSTSASFAVRPFTLPRFHVDAAAGKPFYQRGERPMLKGSVRYSSGAPVARAKVELEWSFSGDWPPPTSWVEQTVLPKEATTNAAGQFEVTLPALPEDLVNQATAQVALSATDPAGDRVEGSASMLFSHDAIKVDAVTELEGGLVQGFNNRLFLRATTADGQVLSGVNLTVKRLWEPTDKGVNARADEDGVATVQLDPGPAVNVVVPPLPFRPPPRETGVQRAGLQDLFEEDSGEARLEDRLVFDRAEKSLEPCARYVTGAEEVTATVLANGSGVIDLVVSPTRLGRCIEPILRGLKFSGAGHRMFSVQYNFNDAELPKLELAPVDVANMPGELQELLTEAAKEVRDCLPSNIESTLWPRQLLWHFYPAKRAFEVSWLPGSAQVSQTRVSEATVRCVEGKFPRLSLPAAPKDEDEQRSPAMGWAQVSVTAPEKYEQVRPEATVKVGYEFLITARKADAVLGTTRWLGTPGAVPALRLRLSSQWVKPGESLTAEVLRGPDFTAELSKKMTFTCGRTTKSFELDSKRKATVEIPADVEGWARVSIDSASAFLFVQPKALLSVSLKAEKERYAPGQLARLELETQLGSKPGPAAVGLFGVDESLSQLAALPGADSLSSLRPSVATNGNFAGLDAQALTQGRIRGANAIAATLLKVSSTPEPAELEPNRSVNGQSVLDTNEALVDHFYLALEALHEHARDWESTAPASEKMSNAALAKLWNQALDSLEARKKPAHDAYGRRLRLHRLPADLLALTDPHNVVVDGARLPEDTENWAKWVAKEQP